ncbi:MAG TPA: S-adenosylmethionine:tRNA ribosyltransferase-isomerase [Acidimicrobiales bacterium]|nr:S-adenosylmethionine:tRNA ribosyltransferase-isomerase [Acidimicrobiales bacterium]
MSLTCSCEGLTFEVPSGRIATEPAEVRGSARDDVRLMVARRHAATLESRPFPAIVDVLAPGDLLVVNVSATLPAALPATRADGTPLRLHLSTRLSDEVWTVELREPAGAGTLPWSHGQVGEVVGLPDGGSAQLSRPYQRADAMAATRLWTASLRMPEPLDQYLAEHGGAVRYGAGGRPWPMSAYQTVYANEPGSAEMPSAGRAFTTDLLTRLLSMGVGVAPLVLHAGLSSPESHELPYPEWFRVPPSTADRVNAARAGRGRIIATGTTVVRALETCADEQGRVRADSGWTNLVVGPQRPARAVDGLLTGWHEPGASHLRLLEAIAGRSMLERCYQRALADGYLWHEFGDLLLILP